MSLNAAAAHAYRIRFRRVLEHIDTHLGEGELTVDRLSGLAAFSKYHFHRQFSALFGIGVHRYVQLVRLKRASYHLAFRADKRILDVALDSGYESHEAFSRAFKKLVGQTPSEFREQPQWEPWHALYQPLTTMRMETMKTDNPAREVKVLLFEETRVAALEHRGAANLVGNSVRQFIEWRRQNHVPPQASATFNVHHTEPGEEAHAEYHLDICAATNRPVTENPFGVVAKTIPGGRCAVLRHVGSEATIGETVRYLYGTWLPGSGEELRDFPLYFQRIRFFPDVPEHEAVTDVFLPIQ